MQSYNDQLSGALMRYQVCNFYISCHSLNANGTFVLHHGCRNAKSLWLDHRSRTNTDVNVIASPPRNYFLSIMLKSVYSSNTNKTFRGTHFNTVYGKHLASETFG